MQEITQLLAGKTGAEFVETVRGIALIASAEGGKMMCSSGCGLPAQYIGLQRCGAPGGLICTNCMQNHFDFINMWDDNNDAIPTCRHCDADVDKTHIYAVDLFDPTAPEMTP